MTQILGMALAFVVALGVLVAFHEYGHFWTARRLGVKVLRFSVGFGRPLWRRRGADGVEYVLALIPLGGYVRMLDEREGDVDPAEAHRAFNRQSVYTRIAIVAAGPIANLVLAVAAYWLMYLIGISALVPRVGAPLPGSAAETAGFRAGELIETVDGRAIESWEAGNIALLDAALNGAGAVAVGLRAAGGESLTRELRVDAGAIERGDDVARASGLRLWQPAFAPVFGEPVTGGAGQRAGLRAGDRVVAVDGEPTADWAALVAQVQRAPGRALLLSIERDGAPLSLRVTPDARAQQGRMIGFINVPSAPDPSAEAALASMRTVVRYGPLQALGRALDRTREMSALSVQMIGRLVTGRASLENISGPVTIARFAGQSASIGFDHYLNFLALISVSLAILNLLPVPVLDGGHLLYFAVELATGRPLSERLQIWGQQLGLVLLVGLMALAFYNDISRLFGG